MEIETKRLRIKALLPEQLAIVADNVAKFESEFTCSYQGETIEGTFKNILFE